MEGSKWWYLRVGLSDQTGWKIGGWVVVSGGEGGDGSGGFMAEGGATVWNPLYTRTLSNLEKYDREWLVYSKELDKGILGVIEILEEFDPIIKVHVRRITSEGLHVHYLGHLIQNELIALLAEEIKKELIKKTKEAKYYSIILDCTPDSSHQEQMTIIVRYLKLSYNFITIEESFLDFLNVDDTSGKGLFDITLEELESLGLQIDDMRDNVKAWSLKSLCQTHWEALFQVGEKYNDAATAGEATSLAEKELSDFEFLVSTVVWYEVLNCVNILSKKLQSKDMHLDNAITEINKLIGGIEDKDLKLYCHRLEKALKFEERSDIDAEEYGVEII
ncbi:uncharacterized protein LOC111898274 [Lactuca sativa]|uniref:uncharacterized protein LOC111898274 n=1 Tax=Lactuca sativa TaxID=4236 RepID=UPI000CD7EF6E|nr:uncharacterized protein LOC111898274 [Lactuca sativa]